VTWLLLPNHRMEDDSAERPLSVATTALERSRSGGADAPRDLRRAQTGRGSYVVGHKEGPGASGHISDELLWLGSLANASALKEKRCLMTSTFAAS
jgi:hypothetical protein